MQRVNREELLSILESLRPGLATKEILEQSNCIAFQDGWAYTFNDEKACFHKLDLGIEGAVPATPLIDLVRKLPDDEIEVGMKGGEFYIRAKKGSSGVKLDETIFLPIDELERPKKKDWFELPEEFAAAVVMAESCVAHNEHDFALSSVHVTSTFVEASDNHQAARYFVHIPIEEDFLVRHGNLREIVGLGVSECALTPAWVHFRDRHGLRVSCRRYIEEYVEEMEVTMSTKRAGKKIVLPSTLIEKTELANIFSKQAITGDKDEILVHLRPGKATVKGIGSLGWYKGDCKMEYDGEEVKFQMAPSMLASLVKQYKACKLCEDCLMVTGSNFKYLSSIATKTEDE